MKSKAACIEQLLRAALGVSDRNCPLNGKIEQDESRASHYQPEA
jgi:hypothetical protein